MSTTLHRGMTIGEIPPTPAQPMFDASRVVPDAYNTLFSCAQEFGNPICYLQEQGGNLVQNLLPVHKTEYRQISTSSKVELELHTETAFHPYKPSHVLLLCLRGDESATTTYAELEDFLSELDDSTLDILQLPLYKTNIDESFRSDGSDGMEIILPVLRQNQNGVFEITYDRNLMSGITSEADSALTRLTNAIMRCIKEVVLSAGDLFVIDNATTVHGRRPFQPKYDGTDRWVLRLLTIKTLPVAQHRTGHIITTRFPAR